MAALLIIPPFVSLEPNLNTTLQYRFYWTEYIFFVVAL